MGSSPADWAMIQICSEIDTENNKHICYHEFYLPHVTEGGYRQIVSFNAFFHGMKKRNWNKNKLYHLTDEITMKFCQYKSKTVKHKDIWAFYKAIGYNYKRKKYMT